MIRANLAAALRRLGRALFRAADRIQPDAITDALDMAYRSGWIYRDQSDKARAWSDREIAAELREIRGTLKPWTPERPTTFKRKQQARR